MDGLIVENLSFRYGGVLAVNDLSFHIRPGEIYGLLGPNGAGKTTTLKILVGLLQMQEGSVTVFGNDLRRDSNSVKQLAAYIPDRAHLYERLTAWEYLEFVAGLWDVPARSGWRETAADLLEKMELSDSQNQLLESFSQGMRQKIMLIGGLIHQPSLWVLDEPLTALDPRSARYVRSLLREQAANGACILLSTHILDIAERMCDRLAIMDRGRKIAEGTLDELDTARQAKSYATASSGRRLEEVFLQLTEDGE